MKVNCVILSYNHPDLTARCVTSALKFFSKDELLLIHNGSEAKNTDKLSKQFPEIRHFHLSHNKGYSGGANHGLSKAFEACDRVLFLTNDCELLKFRTSETKPTYAAPKILKRKTENIDSLGGYLLPEKGLVGHLKSETEWRNFQGLKYIPGSAFLIDKEVWNSGVRFQEVLGTYWEDVLFAQDIQQLGFGLTLAPEIIIRHGIGKTCHKDPHYTSYLFQRNRRWVSEKFNQSLRSKTKFWWHYSLDTSKLLARTILKRDFEKARLIKKAVTEKSQLP